MTHNKTKIIVLCLLCIFIVSCSSKKIAYNWADIFIEEKIDDYFDITETQYDFLKQKIDLLHEWHRREELKQYLKIISSTIEFLEDGISPIELEWLKTELVKSRIRLLNHTIDDTAYFLSTLSNQQIAHLENYLSEGHKVAFEKYSQQTIEAKQELLSRYKTRAEEWLGEITMEQETFFQNLVNTSLSAKVARRKQRRRTQTQFIRLLKDIKNQIDIRNYLSAWIENPEALYSKDYRESLRHSKKEFNKNILAFDSMLTNPQRNHLIHRLQEYIELIDELHNS